MVNPRAAIAPETQAAVITAVSPGKASVLLIDKKYYVCDNAVWFLGDSPTGPWTVATEVPKEVQDIMQQVAREYEARTGTVNKENYPKQIEQLNERLGRNSRNSNKPPRNSGWIPT